jgi:hypothetical protein
MTNEKQQPAKAVHAVERQQRLAAELRANLLKRKALTRLRSETRQAAGDDEPAGRQD